MLEMVSPPVKLSCRIALARDVLRTEALALEQVAQRIGEDFEQVVELLAGSLGRVAVSGVGKSADVARKIVATMNSTGTLAYFLDPTAALHGDLGSVHHNDVVLLLSHSGESEEIVRLLSPLRELASGIAAITGNPGSTLGRSAGAVIAYGPIREADPLGLAPSTSTTIMIALGDALAFTLAEARGFVASDFARIHPAGSLGARLASVDAFMRTGPALRLASADETVRSVFGRRGHGRRRSGAVMLLDSTGRLCGLFTDSDLARLFERRADDALDRPVREVMSTDPLTVPAGSRLIDALDLLKEHKISELPVLDAARRPVGLLDITDLLHLMPAEDEGRRHAA